MGDIAGHRDEIGEASGCADTLADDLGWGLGMLFRAYVKAAHAAVTDLPGGPRGYQVLSPPRKPRSIANSPSPSTSEWTAQS